MLIDDFNRTIDIYIKELGHYSVMQLLAKPSANSFSLGQMYSHLIADTRFYIEQIKICTSNNDHYTEEASPHAKSMFQNNEFPDEVIEGAPDNAFIPQPVNKEQLRQDLLNLKAAMNEVVVLISKSTFRGKTKHPGLDYFSAEQWLQFADMHFRHHLRQKKRLEEFLKNDDTMRRKAN